MRILSLTEVRESEDTGVGERVTRVRERRAGKVKRDSWWERER